MSGLEKFQANEAWRTNFKKFLFMERKPEVVQQTLTITESQRYSLDIGEDLKNIIEQKKNKKTVQINPNTEIINISNTTSERQPEDINMDRYDETVYGELPMWQKTSDESFEALEKMCEKTVSDPNSTLFKYLNGEDEEQKNNNVVVWQKTSDESFEALERMCDKTASDPNSTLFQYLHSDRREQVLAEVKKRSVDENTLNVKQQEDNLLMKLSNCTLLDDVEAPSRMWENTICGETVLQTSPVKMVGLLRPSTIIEEAPDDSTNSDVSSQMSFQTATKGAHSDVSSSAYETAHDSTAASNRTDYSNKYLQQQLEVIDVDDIVFGAIAKNEQCCEKDKEAAIIPSLEIMDATIVESDLLTNKSEAENNSNGSDTSVDLIDLEKTFGPLHGSPHSSIIEAEDIAEDNPVQHIIESNDKELEDDNDLDDSIIEILSDEDDVLESEDVPNEDEEEQILYTNIKMEMSSKAGSFSLNQDTYSFSESVDDDKENLSAAPEQSNKSMQFNDTMEEVEYMLKKGMEYMAAEAAAKKSPPKAAKAPVPVCNVKVSKTQPNSPMINKKPNAQVSSSASKVKSSVFITPAKKATTATKAPNSSNKRFDIDIRPFPKLDIFAKPAVHARTKELTSKQQKFSHIVSPIGAYMKKTAKTPLMSSINCKNKDYFNSTAILELENESRLYQPTFVKDSNGGSEASGQAKLPGLTNYTKRPLPKKAYISSDLKQIVDERTPVTIPGGKKIQKYLENAMMPAVLRHEGKLKIPGGGLSNTKSNMATTTTSSQGASSKLPLKVTDTNSTVTARSSHIPRRNNASLADLSVMSGDVSLYTIMDAQKF